jgi:hypothetical protein
MPDDESAKRAIARDSVYREDPRGKVQRVHFARMTGEQGVAAGGKVARDACLYGFANSGDFFAS